MIQGVFVSFPYKPYDCQINYIEAVIDSIINNKFAALESPTGTGKTLSLLCATLSSIAKNEKCQNFYWSRNHSQLSNVVKELRKTTYNPKICVLGSKKVYCINDDENLHLKGTIDQNCQQLQRS